MGEPTLPYFFLFHCSLSYHKRYQLWEDGHVLLIMCILDKYWDGHLICFGALSSFRMTVKAEKVAHLRHVFKMHSLWQALRKLPSLGVFLCSRRVNEFWWSLLLCLNHHVVLGNKIQCSHRVHSHMALPALSNILKLWACCPCCTFCQTAQQKKEERESKSTFSFLAYYLSPTNLLFVTFKHIFFKVVDIVLRNLFAFTGLVSVQSLCIKILKQMCLPHLKFQGFAGLHRLLPLSLSLYHW